MSDYNNPPPVTPLQPPMAQPVQPPVIQYQAPQPPPPPAKKRGFLGCLGTLACILVVLVLLAVISVIGLFGYGIYIGIKDSCSGDFSFNTFSGADKEIRMKTLEKGFGTHEYIAVITINGVIAFGNNYELASAQRIIKLLKAAMEDDNAVAILLDMNTPGGEVVASDEIRHQIDECRSIGKPVVTCMRSMGASGGYFIASGSDWIIANRLTFTGSVGVIMNGLQYSELLGKIGVASEVYRSGDMKDMLNPARPRTEQERVYVQKMIDDSFTEFCKVVASGRPAYETADDVKKSPFGDGRVVSGADALAMGLIDQLGYFDDAVEKARELSDCEDAGIILYEGNLSFFDLLFAKAGKTPEMKISGLPQAAFIPQPGCMYYLDPILAGISR